MAAGLGRSHKIEAARRQGAPCDIVEQGLNCRVVLGNGQLRRRLGRRHVDHDHPLEPLGRPKGLKICPNPFNRSSRRFHQGRRFGGGKARDLVTGSHDRARPQPLIRGGKEVASRVEQVGRDCPALPPHAFGFLPKRSWADIVPTDHQVVKGHQPELGEGLTLSH